MGVLVTWTVEGVVVVLVTMTIMATMGMMVVPLMGCDGWGVGEIMVIGVVVATVMVVVVLAVVVLVIVTIVVVVLVTIVVVVTVATMVVIMVVAV